MSFCIAGVGALRAPRRRGSRRRSSRRRTWPRRRAGPRLLPGATGLEVGPAGQPSVARRDRGRTAGRGRASRRSLRSPSARREWSRGRRLAPRAIRRGRRIAASGSAGSLRVATTSWKVDGAVDEPRDTVARGAAGEPVKVVEHQRRIAECAVNALTSSGRRTLTTSADAPTSSVGTSRPPSADTPAQRREHVRPEHDRVVVAFVEAQPRDGPLRRLRVAPGSKERRLAAPGRRGEHRPSAWCRSRARSRSTRRSRATVCFRHGGAWSFVVNRGRGQQARVPPSAQALRGPCCPGCPVRRSLLGKSSRRRRTPLRGRSRRDVHPGEVALGSARPHLPVR